MTRMLPGIDTLEQHQERLRDNPDAYRPERCPHCGKSDLHHHGHYARNAPRGEGMALLLGMVLILRFYCPACRRTCSRLPSCLSPRRQYWWKSQQAVLAWLLLGQSIRAVAQRLRPSRRTIRRWWCWLQTQFHEHSFHLRSRFPELGRTADFNGFWSRCFECMNLSEAMCRLDRVGVNVP